MNWDLHRSLCFVILQVICFLLKPALTSCKTSNASSIICSKHNGKKNCHHPSSRPTLLTRKLQSPLFLCHMVALCWTPNFGSSEHGCTFHSPPTARSLYYMVALCCTAPQTAVHPIMAAPSTHQIDTEG